MIELLKLTIDDHFNFDFYVSFWFLLVVFLIIFIGIFLNRILRKKRYSRFEINEAEIGIGNQRIKIKPNYEDLQIAYKLWTELSTRKIGLPIDQKNDVIVEVYNSWYEFFKITRELIKTIPVSKIQKNESTKKLVEISIKILNEELRPHLTKWQAKFRYWYEKELIKDENNKIAPQEIQQKYPEFDQLIIEMKSVNNKLVKYTDFLRRFIFEN